VSPGKAPKSTLLAFRLPDELIVRVDAYAAKLGTEARWTRVTRADAVRALLTQALDANRIEGPAPSQRGRGKQ